MTFRTASSAALLGFAALLCFAGASAAAPQTVREPGDEVRAVQLTTPLRIDGRLDEEIYA